MSDLVRTIVWFLTSTLSTCAIVRSRVNRQPGVSIGLLVLIPASIVLGIGTLVHWVATMQYNANLFRVSTICNDLGMTCVMVAGVLLVAVPLRQIGRTK